VIGASQHAAPDHDLPQIELHGVRLTAVTEAQCIAHILDSLAIGRGGWVVTPNLDILRRLVRDDSFRRLTEEATLMVADGMPLLWAARLQGTALPGRVAGSDLISSLSEAAAEAGRSIYLLGGAPGTAQTAARTLQDRHPNLKVCGTYCPEMGFEHNAREKEKTIDHVVGANPDIVFVALGSPKQEALIRQLRMRRPQAWYLGVGISFSFLSGEVRRAPRWMQRIGLEWFHRLTQEPRRLAKRYLVDGLPFALALLCRSAWRGLTRGRARRVRKPEAM
jgi:N-acetylglucosaminyldiphosphoundecaprenol N-acetyl-beta-D-mannosaminyltransferase